MAIRLPIIRSAKKVLLRNLSNGREEATLMFGNVPKGYIPVYVGEEQKRFVVPISYLNKPAFQELLGEAEEEFGFDHPKGGLTIPCSEEIFINLTSQLQI